MSNGPIIIVEHNHRENTAFEKVIRDLGFQNTVVHFSTASAALQYLSESSELIFVIFSDLCLEDVTGIEFKTQIDTTPELRRKSIPFVFFTSSVTDDDVNAAFMQLSVQGFFKNPETEPEFKRLLQTILEYWKACNHPNMH